MRVGSARLGTGSRLRRQGLCSSLGLPVLMWQWAGKLSLDRPHCSNSQEQPMRGNHQLAPSRSSGRPAELWWARRDGATSASIGTAGRGEKAWVLSSGRSGRSGPAPRHMASQPKGFLEGGLQALGG